MKKSGLVAIIGRPNAGKSTLLNALIGTELSIVTPKAQTTRDNVKGILTQDGGQIVFIDTPGIHKAAPGGINEFMVSEAKTALEAPHVIWYLVDPNSSTQHEQTVLEHLKGLRAPVLVVFTKSDLKRNIALFLEKLRTLLIENGLQLKEVLEISARNKKGLKILLDKTWELLPEGPFFYPNEDDLSDRPLRFFVAEKIREQLYLQLGDELPYSCAVKIEKFDESSKPVRIEADIFVERDSQKGMVVGAGGSKIKSIGISARQSIEQLVDAPIFLGLKVKVLKNWTKDKELLKKMGYSV